MYCLRPAGALYTDANCDTSPQGHHRYQAIVQALKYGLQFSGVSQVYLLLLGNKFDKYGVCQVQRVCWSDNDNDFAAGSVGISTPSGTLSYSDPITITGRANLYMNEAQYQWDSTTGSWSNYYIGGMSGPNLHGQYHY